VQELIPYLEKNIINQKFSAYLIENAPEIVDLFHHVPESNLTQIRLNVYLEFTALNNYLYRVLQLLLDNQDLNETIYRIEVANDEIARQDNASFATLIIYLVPFTNIGSSEVLQKLLSSLSLIFPTIPTANLNTEFAYGWLPAVTVTQGFKLYKRYLNILGLLDKIYDKKTNYAFCNHSASTLVSLFRQVGSA
jgi:hypothetical protein